MLSPAGLPGSVRKPKGPAAPAHVLLAADAGPFASLGGEDVGVVGVLVAPARIGVQSPGLDGESERGVAAERGLRRAPCGMGGGRPAVSYRSVVPLDTSSDT